MLFFVVELVLVKVKALARRKDPKLISTVLMAVLKKSLEIYIFLFLCFRLSRHTTILVSPSTVFGSCLQGISEPNCSKWCSIAFKYFKNKKWMNIENEFCILFTGGSRSWPPSRFRTATRPLVVWPSSLKESATNISPSQKFPTSWGQYFSIVNVEIFYYMKRTQFLLLK